jgi:hypothetical protein
MANMEEDFIEIGRGKYTEGYAPEINAWGRPSIEIHLFS